jgi:UDP-2,3-diacylglucosamine pyrophosphatase LpxH
MAFVCGMSNCILAYYRDQYSTAWLAVTLHHPVFTKTVFKQHFIPLLKKYKVDIIFVGHEHECEYSNMKFDYELRFPNSDYGDVLWDCKKEREILNHKERVQTFTKGEHMHYFLVGHGGANFRYFLSNP